MGADVKTYEIFHIRLRYIIILIVIFISGFKRRINPAELSRSGQAFIFDARMV